MDDAECLRRYVEAGSELAFAELVRRNLDLVYSAALRQVRGDPHRAQEVAQNVFILLARNARALRRHPYLTAWLYTATRQVAANLWRSEQRRRIREHQAFTMQASSDSPEPDWTQVSAVLDSAMGALSEEDQTVVLLRFFESRSHAEVGAKLGIADEAARKRSERALARLGAVLRERGVVSTEMALAAALSAQAVRAAPAGVAAGILEAAAAAGAGTAGLLTLMSTAKAAFSLSLALALGGAAAFVYQQHAVSRLEAANRELSVQAREAARLQAANRHLLLAERAAAERLIARPKGTPPKAAAALAPGMMAQAAWGNVGLGTPAATWQTFMWGHREAEPDAMATALRFSEADQAAALDLFGRLPPAVQAEYGSPEKLLALIFAAIDPYAGFQIDSTDFPTPTTAHAEISLEEADGQVRKSGLNFQLGPSGWQIVVPLKEFSGNVGRILNGPPHKD